MLTCARACKNTHSEKHTCLFSFIITHTRARTNTETLALEGDDVWSLNLFTNTRAHPHACIHTSAGMSVEYANAYTQAKALSMHQVFRCVLASLYEGLSIRRSVGPSVGPSVCPSIRLSVRPSPPRGPKSQPGRP